MGAVTAPFTHHDLERLTQVVADAWRSGADRDWSARAGTLDWSCARTADHAVDTVLAPAFFLASRRQDGYPEWAGPFRVGRNASPGQLVEALETATRILVAVIVAAEPGARAVIWRRPQVEVRGPEDFAARGALELVLHGHDVCRGLGVAYDPPAEVCERLRDHTRDWPHWGSPGWRALPVTDDPWADLLAGSGRSEAAGGR
jgi:hypothetical protein